MRAAYQQGCDAAQHALGLSQVKEAGIKDWLIRRLARGKGLVRPVAATRAAAQTATELPLPTLREKLIGNPEHLFTRPGELLRDAFSLKPAQEAITAIRGQGPGGSGLWARTKGVGRLSLEALNKATMLGIPAYGIHQALTTPRAPGETTGERVGRALGEGLGWLPPSGALGFILPFTAPDFSLPGLLGRAGGAVGHGVSRLLGEKPAPMYPLNYMTGLSPAYPQEMPQGIPQESYYDPDKQLLENRKA